MSSSSKRLQFTFDWRASLLVLLLLPVVTSLGFWQLSRAEEKRQMLALFEDRQARGPVAIEQSDADADLRYQPVALRGRFLNDQNLLLDNRIYQRRFGYEIITPFLLADSQQLVLVNRGWLQGDVARRALPEVAAVTGTVELGGEIYVPQGEVMLLAEDRSSGWPRVVQAVNIEQLQKEFKQPLFPYTVRLQAASPGALQPNWLVVNLQPEKHTGYAVQWFSMGIALLIIALLANTNIWRLLKREPS